MAPVPADPIQYAQTGEGIVVVRVQGKGSHLQTPGLRHVFDTTRKQDPPVRYIIDLDQCTTLDSTFMGMLASMAIHQRETCDAPMVLTNIQDHVRYLLQTLGLNFLLDMRSGPAAKAERLQPEAFKPADAPEMSTMDRIVMMIEAHEKLVDVDSGNEIKFEGVLKTLRESLDRAKQKPPNPTKKPE
jgi:anti-anti-sigma regulatory factor